MCSEQQLAPVLDLTGVLHNWRGGHRDRRAVADVVTVIAETGARLASAIAASAEPLGRSGAEGQFVKALAGRDVAAICSAESVDPIEITAGASLIVTLDPVAGSSNLDINGPIGTIFSVLPTAGFAGDLGAAVLQPGRDQLAAGILVYGARTVLALTLGAGTDVFVLNPATRRFTLTRRGVQLPIDAPEYAVNAANARHWGPGVRSYINDLVSGSGGPRGRDFNMRWFAALASDAYRILIRGGIFLYPADERPDYREGRIRLVYEANPVALLCEQAGGLATDGINRVLDLVPTALHQRTPFIFGSRDKVERVRRYLLDPAATHERSPLFSQRGLYRV